MKILLTITHGNVGGATNVVYELARGLRAEDVDVAVGFSEGKYLEEKLAAASMPSHHFKHLQRTRNPFAAFLFIFEMRRFVRKERIDVVQCNSTNTLPGCLGAKLAFRKVKTVFTVHGLSVLDEHYEEAPFWKLAYRVFFKVFFVFVDVPVFVSKSDLAAAHQLGLAHGGTLIYNGFRETDLELLPADEARQRLGAKFERDFKNFFIIGSIGRLSYQKNYEFLIRAFRDIRAIKENAVAILIGDGPKKEELENLASVSNLRSSILFTGELDDAARYLKAFDLFVLPSRYEGLPVTLTECLFAEVPVIASDVGGNKEISTKQSLYRLNNREEFLEKFRDMLRNPKPYIVDDKDASKFVLKTMAEHYKALFKALVRSSTL